VGRPTSWRLRGEFFSSRVRLVSGVAPFWRFMLRRVDFLDAGTEGGVSSKAVVALRARGGPCAAAPCFFAAFVFFLLLEVPDRCDSYR
jgi:hypothetical protein